MLKARGQTMDGEVALLFGLSRENVTRLVSGKPIRVDLTELGLPGDVYIFFGETEDALSDEMAHAFPQAEKIDKRRRD